MRTLRYFQVDAFTSELFKGNPAGVCILEDGWLPEALMQQIAFENNQAETAFVLPQGSEHAIRWFSPTTEIDLCGHATLASAFVLSKGKPTERFNFHSKSGLLTVTAKAELLELDFPARPARKVEAPQELIEGLGKAPAQTLQARDWMAVFESEEDIRAIRPRFDVLSKLPGPSIIATAPGKDCDFVSRFFAPGFGVNEDPVTGSSHCTLIPYWAERLGKNKLHARQLSARTGELFCELRGDRVGIAGRAVLYSSGHLALADY